MNYESSVTRNEKHDSLSSGLRVLDVSGFVLGSERACAARRWGKGGGLGGRHRAGDCCQSRNPSDPLTDEILALVNLQHHQPGSRRVRE
eukprot:2706610-Rhodomonas_salina.6